MFNEYRIEDFIELLNNYDCLEKEANTYNGCAFGSEDTDSCDFSINHELLDIKEDIFAYIEEHRDGLLRGIKYYPDYARVYKKKFLLWCDIYDKER